MNKILIRILLSPFIFLLGIFVTMGLCLFPIPVLMMYGLVNLITQPFIYFINKGGTKMEYLKSFLSEYDHKIFKNYFISNLTCILLPIVLPILFIMVYIIKGKIILNTEYEKGNNLIYRI